MVEFGAGSGCRGWMSARLSLQGNLEVPWGFYVEFLAKIIIRALAKESPKGFCLSGHLHDST